MRPRAGLAATVAFVATAPVGCADVTGLGDYGPGADDEEPGDGDGRRTEPCTYAAEDFSDEMIDPLTSVAGEGLEIEVVGGRLELRVMGAAGTSGLLGVVATPGPVALDDCATYLEVTDVDLTESVAFVFGYAGTLGNGDAGGFAGFVVAGGVEESIQAQQSLGEVPFLRPFDPTLDRWLQIEPEGTTLVFSTSADGRSFVELGRFEPTTFDPSSAQVVIGIALAGATESSVVAVDNFNLPPSASP